MVLKDLQTPLTEELVTGWVGKLIHVTTNKHKSFNPLLNKEVEENVWFAGKVAGWEKRHLAYDYLTDTFNEEPLVYYTILLTDGMSYVLSSGDVEVEEITLEKLTEMVEEQQRKKAVKDSILLPNKDF